MQNIYSTLSLVAPVICTNPKCEGFAKNYDLLCYSLEDAQYAASTFEDDATSTCPCCDQLGRLDDPYSRYFDFLDNGLTLLLQFDDPTLDALILLLRNMQDDDVRGKEQVFLATDEAYCIANSFHVVEQFAFRNPGDTSYSLISEYPFDERNKVLIASSKGIKLQVDVTPKNTTDQGFTTVESRIYTLKDLLDLKSVAKYCSHKKKQESEAEVAEEIEVSTENDV